MVLNTRNYHLVNYQVWIKDKKVQLRLSHQHYQIDLANIDGFKVGRKIEEFSTWRDKFNEAFIFE